MMPRASSPRSKTGFRRLKETPRASAARSRSLGASQLQARPLPVGKLCPFPTLGVLHPVRDVAQGVLQADLLAVILEFPSPGGTRRW